MTTNLLAAIIVTITAFAGRSQGIEWEFDYLRAEGHEYSVPGKLQLPSTDGFKFRKELGYSKDGSLVAQRTAPETELKDLNGEPVFRKAQGLVVSANFEYYTNSGVPELPWIPYPFAAVTNFSTNVAEHWPQKQVENPHTGAPLYSLTDGSLWHEDHWGTHSENDTDADTKSVEYTVTARRLLSFEFERQRIEHELTNWTEAHYSVEYRRVRTSLGEGRTSTTLSHSALAASTRFQIFACHASGVISRRGLGHHPASTCHSQFSRFNSIQIHYSRHALWPNIHPCRAAPPNKGMGQNNHIQHSSP